MRYITSIALLLTFAFSCATSQTAAAATVHSPQASAARAASPMPGSGQTRYAVGDGRMHADAVDATSGTVALVTGAADPPSAAPATTPAHSLALVLLFALLGGLLLNLMPCVFPVLSLKALALLESRDRTRAEQRHHGYAYSLGVVLSTVSVAALLLALRAGGEALGWGFQLQSPVFVAVLAYVIFVLGLSMSGVIGFGNQWMGVGQSLTRGHGYAGSFFTGVLAVVVASPCSAPFMGTALGYALTQPTAMALAIFAVLGLGLALPFLLVGLFPRLGIWLPRPGVWMETFKQLMAFPLYLTAIWLVWVLARQEGADATGLALIGMLLLALGLWARGRWPQARSALALLVVCVIGAGWLLTQPALNRAPQLDTTHSGTAQGDTVQPAHLAAGAVQPYSAATLTALRKQGRTVFVNFTADWCISCQVNEHVALVSDAVHQAFARYNVARLKGDWTHSDPAITRALAQFGRSGVPLYLVYPHGGAAIVLPQVLTPQTVIDAIRSKPAVQR